MLKPGENRRLTGTIQTLKMVMIVDLMVVINCTGVWNTLILICIEKRAIEFILNSSNTYLKRFTNPLSDLTVPEHDIYLIAIDLTWIQLIL